MLAHLAAIDALAAFLAGGATVALAGLVLRRSGRTEPAERRTDGR